MDLLELYNQYGKEKVDEAIAVLTYKTVTPLPKTTNVNSPILYVFRHGESADNITFTFSGWRNPDLTELGKQQALQIASKIQHLKIDKLYASDLTRAIKTMELAISQNNYAKNLLINQDKRLRERYYGDLQGQSKLQIYLENPELLKSFRRGYDGHPPNGESIKMTIERVTPFIDELVNLMKKEQINVAVACHGNSIRAFRQRFENLTNEQTASIETALAQDYAAYSIN